MGQNMGVGKKKVITCCGATCYHFQKVSKMRTEPCYFLIFHVI